MTSEKVWQAYEEALGKLRSRPLPLSERSARGREAALFHAIEAIRAEESGSRLGEVWPALAEEFTPRLGDSQLAPAILELSASCGALESALSERVSHQGRSSSAWGVHGQILLLMERSSSGMSFNQALSLVLQSEAGQELDTGTALAVLEQRGPVPLDRRDPVSTQFCETALRSLAGQLDQSEVRGWIWKTISWELARAGKEEPSLALAGLELLEQFPLIERLKYCRLGLQRFKRRMVQQRLQSLQEVSEGEAGLPVQQLNDVLADPLQLPEGVTLGANAVLSYQPDFQLEDGEKRSLQREADRVWEQWATRFELALVNQERWPLQAWRAAFAESGCKVREELTRHLLWVQDDGDGPGVALRWDGSFKDVFGEEYKAESVFIRIAHPLLMDAEELSLWQEQFLLSEQPQAFAQVFRNFFADFSEASFIGVPFPVAVPKLSRARTWIGLPLRATGKEEIRRRIGAREVEISFTAIGQKIESITWDEEPGELERSELALDLFDLIGASFFGDAADWLRWNKDLQKDPQAAWKQALDRYKQAHKRLPGLRLKLIEALKSKIPAFSGLRVEGRFVVIDGAGGGIIELGSGNLHRSDGRAYVPERAGEEIAVPLPHPASSDPQTARVLGRIAWLAKQASS